MESKRNSGCDSGVKAYEIGPDYIRVQFSGVPYVYTYRSNETTSQKWNRVKQVYQ